MRQGCAAAHFARSRRRPTMTMFPADCAAVTAVPGTPSPSGLEKFLRLLSVVTMLMTVPQSSPCGSVATRVGFRCYLGQRTCSPPVFGSSTESRSATKRFTSPASAGSRSTRRSSLASWSIAESDGCWPFRGNARRRSCIQCVTHKMCEHWTARQCLTFKPRSKLRRTSLVGAPSHRPTLMFDLYIFLTQPAPQLEVARQNRLRVASDSQHSPPRRFS